MKKITSLILSAAMALSIMPSMMVLAAGNVKTEAYTMSNVPRFEKALGGSETEVFTDGVATWYGRELTGDMYFKNDEWTGKNSIKWHGYVGSATASAAFDLGDKRVLGGVTEGQGTFWGANNVKGNGAAELRYLVSADSSSYFGFGVDYYEEKTTTTGDDGQETETTVRKEKPYYTLSGTKTYIPEGNNWTRKDTKLSFTMSDTTVSYTISADTQTVSGSFEVSNVAELVENQKYPMQVYVNLSGWDSQFYAGSLSLTYTTVPQPTELKAMYELHGISDFSTSISDKDRGTEVMNDGGAVWYGKRTDGSYVAVANDEWDDTGSYKVKAYGPSYASCILNTGNRVVNGITAGSVTLNTNNTKDAGIAEFRWMISADFKSYFGFGIDVVNGMPYYTVSGTKTDFSDDIELGTWPAGATKISFTVSGTTVNYKLSAGSYELTGSFEVSNMADLIANAEYHMQSYFGGVYDKQLMVQHPSISYITIPGPNFVDDFSTYNATNSAYGEANAVGYCGHKEGSVIASGENGAWTLSSMVSGLIDSGADAWTHHQKAYIKNSGEYKESLYLDSSSPVCGVNLNVNDRIYDVNKIELVFTGSRSQSQAVRFMVSDYEKTAYEIGTENDGVPFVRKHQGMYAGQFNYFSQGVAEGSTVKGSSDIVGWDGYAGYENQGKRKLKLTITMNETGFDYKLENLSIPTLPVFSGTYVDPTGSRIKPNYDKNPVLQVVNANGKQSKVAEDGTVTEYVGTIVDDVKLWYETKAIKSAAVKEDGSVDVIFSTEDFVSDGEISVVTAWYDENGATIGITSKKVEDDDSPSTSVNVKPTSGAVKGKIWFWNGDLEAVDPFSNESLDITL